MDEYIRKADATNKLYYEYQYGADIDRCGLATAMDVIDEIESADVVKVVHGTWLPTNDDNKKRCNKCNMVVLIAMYPSGSATFCPNCGAKMDGGELDAAD